MPKYLVNNATFPDFIKYLNSEITSFSHIEGNREDGHEIILDELSLENASTLATTTNNIDFLDRIGLLNSCFLCLRNLSLESARALFSLCLEVYRPENDYCSYILDGLECEVITALIPIITKPQLYRTIKVRKLNDVAWRTFVDSLILPWGDQDVEFIIESTTISPAAVKYLLECLLEQQKTIEFTSSITFEKSPPIIEYEIFKDFMHKSHHFLIHVDDVTSRSNSDFTPTRGSTNIVPDSVEYEDTDEGLHAHLIGKYPDFALRYASELSLGELKPPLIRTTNGVEDINFLYRHYFNISLSYFCENNSELCFKHLEAAFLCLKTADYTYNEIRLITKSATLFFYLLNFRFIAKKSNDYIDAFLLKLSGYYCLYQWSKAHDQKSIDEYEALTALLYVIGMGYFYRRKIEIACQFLTKAKNLRASTVEIINYILNPKDIEFIRACNDSLKRKSVCDIRMCYLVLTKRNERTIHHSTLFHLPELIIERIAVSRRNPSYHTESEAIEIIRNTTRQTNSTGMKRKRACK